MSASTTKKPNRAPPAVAIEWVTPLTADDVQHVTGRFGRDLDQRYRTDVAERLNEAVSEYLWDAPGTVGRQAELLRYAWYTEVVATAQHLQDLLRPEESAALLLSGVGQPMLWLSSIRGERLTLAQWRARIDTQIDSLEFFALNARRGVSSVERHIFQVRTGGNGWVTVLPKPRKGRPKEPAFGFLADEFLLFWKHLTDSEPTVIVDPLEPSNRRSAAADFVAEMLEIVASRLEPKHDWAMPRLQGTAGQIIVHIERQQRPYRKTPNRKKRGAA